MIGLALLVSLLMLALFLVLAIITPAWHWVATVIAIIAGLLALRWTIHLIATQTPGYKENVSILLGVVELSVLTMGFIIAAVGYFLCLLWWRSRG